MYIDWPHAHHLDSPLASRFTQAYRELNDFWNDKAEQRHSKGRKPTRFRQLITFDSHVQHQKTVNYLASTGRPAIVIAGNGICSGGRINNYLKAILGVPRYQVLFVGYQAGGAPGANIQASEGVEGFAMIDLDGEMYEINSAHADQKGLGMLRSTCRKAAAGQTFSGAYRCLPKESPMHSVLRALSPGLPCYARNSPIPISCFRAIHRFDRANSVVN
ncbi:hypothetical protein [Pseudomonas qingdaonensis]|uniref:hypothetical protein n=1 Tax=Pseudomonas qingdaonensis TaxID=2056231 RepID=UPI003084091D